MPIAKEGIGAMNPELLLLQKEAETLGADESIRIHCPFCKDKTEKTCSITRKTGFLLYNCYRASCNRHGIIGDSFIPTKKSTKEFEPKYFTGDSYLVEQSDLDSIGYDKYLTLDDCDTECIRISHKEKRLIFPLYTYAGYQWGEMTKTWIKGKKPKTILYRHEDVPTIHFPFFTIQDSIMYKELCIVEDILSAIKVSKITPCCAILGTHLSEDMFKLLSSQGWTTYILMLDNDATLKSIGIKNKYGSLANFHVIPMSKDPKEHTLDELEEMVKPYI